MEEQARIAYEKVPDDPGGRRLRARADVTRVTENVTLAGLDDYAAAAGRPARAVRRAPADRCAPSSWSGWSAAPRCWRSSCTRSPAAATELLAASEPRRAGTWRASPVAEGHDGVVYLPTVAAGRRRRRGRAPRATSSASTRYCLDRAGDLLAAVGLSLGPRGHHLRLLHAGHPRRLPPDPPRAAGAARRRRCLPGCRRHPDEPAAPPGRARRARRDRVPAPARAGQPGLVALRHATYAPGVKAGRTLYMSRLRGARHGDAGGAAPRRRRRPGRGRPTARSWTCSTHAGPRARRPAGDHRVLRRVGAAATTGRWPGCASGCSSPPWPASTGAICAGLLRPEFLLEVFPTAVYPEGDQ